MKVMDGMAPVVEDIKTKGSVLLVAHRCVITSFHLTQLSFSRSATLEVWSDAWLAHFFLVASKSVWPTKLRKKSSSVIRHIRSACDIRMCSKSPTYQWNSLLVHYCMQSNHGGYHHIYHSPQGASVDDLLVDSPLMHKQIVSAHIFDPLKQHTDWIKPCNTRKQTYQKFRD